MGYIFGVKDDHPDWGAMNAAFGTTKTTWSALTDAGTKARHLKLQDVADLTSRSRDDLLGAAHDALTRAINHVRRATGSSAP